MCAVLVCCPDLFTMHHAQHHKSGIECLLSGITGLVFEFFITLLYRKTTTTKSQPPFGRRELSRVHLQVTHLCIWVFFLNILVIMLCSSWINKRSDWLFSDRDTWASVFVRWEPHWHAKGTHKSRKCLQPHGWTPHEAVFQAVIYLISKLFILYRAAVWFLFDTVESGILLLSPLWGQQWKWTEFRQMGLWGMRQGKEILEKRGGASRQKRGVETGAFDETEICKMNKRRMGWW